MKKIRWQLAAVALSALLACFISGCGSQSAPVETDAAAAVTAEQLLAPERTIATAVLDTQPEEVVKFNWIGVDASYLYRASGEFLEYYDFDQQAWRSLCSAPNCNHTTEQCGAYTGASTWVDDTIGYAGKIYYLRCVDMNQVSLNCFDPMEQTHKEICRLDPLGDFSGNPTTCFIRDGVFFYQENATLQEGEDIVNVFRVDQIDLSSGKVTCSEVQRGTGCTLLGIYQDQLIGVSWSDPTQSPEFDPEAAASYAGGYYEYLNTIPVTLTLCTMPTNTENASWTVVWSKDDAQDYAYAAHGACYGAYFIVNHGSDVFAVDVLSGEEKSLFTGDGVLVSQEAIIGNELFYIDIAEQTEDGTVYGMEKKVLDLTTGNDFSLGETSGTGNPFSGNSSFLVQEAVQYISREDYYQGKWDRWISLE